MAAAPLPTELVSLVHHIELNKAGWWEKAIQRLILASVWLSGNKLELDGILKALRENFQANLDRNRAQTQLSALCSTGELICLPSGDFKISEATLKRFENDLKDAEDVEKKTTAVFIALLKENCPGLDGAEVWNRFQEDFLLPLIRGIGANTYQLISGGAIKLDTTKFGDFVREYHAEHHPGLRDTVTAFMNPKDPFVRSYILRTLNTYFFMESASLGKETLERLSTFSNLKVSFIIFVDTNFLFSILGLHENPSNEAALLLIQLTKQLSQVVDARLYVLPPTLEETRRVLIGSEKHLSNLRLSPNLAGAALNAGIRGLSQKFFQEAAKGGVSFGAKDFFGPYISDLVTIARSKGVELFNENVNNYRTDQKVIDDITDQLEFEKRYERSKSYEQLEHDIVLWHFVQRKRSAQVESPLEGKYWIVTIDYRFLGFDAFKRRNLARTVVPICLHPTTLIQMLQFWIPRTREFEEAMLSSIRLPFLFHEFDQESERITIRILEALGRFENAGDLSQETVTSVLLNNALRQKLKVEEDVQKQVELVREALIEEHQQTEQKLRETSEKAARLENEVQTKAGTITALEEMIDERTRRIADYETELTRERKASQSLEEKMAKLESNLEKQQKQIEEEGLRKERRWFVTKCVAVAIVFMAAGFLLSVLGQTIVPWPLWKIMVFTEGLLLMLWIGVIDYYGSGNPRITEWKVFMAFQKLKKFLFGGVGLGVLGNAAWDWLKRMW